MPSPAPPPELHPDRVATIDPFGRDHPVLGEAVLHLDHGIARLTALEAVDGPLGTRDFLRLTFAEDEALLVPVAELTRVWRYGPWTPGTPLDALKGGDWTARRGEAMRALEEDAARIAARLAERRAARPAPVVWDDAAMARVAEGFGHDLTPDQAAAVDAVLDGLRGGRLIERVVIGDVGFGKTEVALRAMAAVALAGGQAILAAPTTILARQHAETLRRRLPGIEIVELSGLSEDPDEARRALREGAAIGVGTHALAAGGTRYADLRLVVIDEEHRFGAAQKRALRRLATDCHLLGLSATPIPRTMAAAESGLMEVSAIVTAPRVRAPVATRIAERSDRALGAALLTEAARGGRSFVVAPRIADLPAAEAAIRAEAPGLTLAIAHGRMPDEDVAAALRAFAGGTAEVLLSTTIVENGIDVPEAGTMAILNANRLGLAQLHQLRGRVGRGGSEGRAIAFVPRRIGAAARARLAAWEAACAVGAGIALSHQDMGARGAGRIGSDDQAGHLARLGIGLHRHLSDRAMRRTTGEDLPPLEETYVHVNDAGRLPDGAPEHPDARIALYALLMRAESDDDLADALAALDEATGGPAKGGDDAPGIEALRRAARRRLACRRAGVTEAKAGPKGVVLTLADFALEDPGLDARIAAVEAAAGPVKRRGRSLLIPASGALAGDALEDAALAALGVPGRLTAS